MLNGGFGDSEEEDADAMVLSRFPGSVRSGDADGGLWASTTVMACGNDISA